MKTFKKLDFRVSCLLIALAFLIPVVKQEIIYMYPGYFIVGGWQLISLFTHTINNWFISKGSKRNIYHRVVFTILITSLLESIFNITAHVLQTVLIFTKPFLTVYYTWFCYYELNVKMKRPIALLK